MKYVLICGSSSFVSQGVSEKLIEEGYEVDRYSRGKEGRDGQVVKGTYLNIDENRKLNSCYDIVVNYAILKDKTVEQNIQYIKSLLQLCREKGVKKLIHFSSVMVYGHDVGVVNEEAPMESSEKTWMEGYGKIKIKVDEYLNSIRGTVPFEIVLVRPGYVLADGRPCPFIKPLPMGIALIKGDRKSMQPIVKREEIHEAILKIIQTDNNYPVYLLFPNDGMTKYRFAKKMGYKHLIGMPRIIFKYIPYLMMKIGLMSKSLYSRFDGMYNENTFSSKLTEEKLNVKFT